MTACVCDCEPDAAVPDRMDAGPHRMDAGPGPNPEPDEAGTDDSGMDDAG